MITRRQFASGVMTLPLLGQARADSRPWRASFFAAGPEGDAYEGGFHVEMAEGWKTYWRVPGAGGIPPEIMAKGKNLGHFQLFYPVPSRFQSEEGEIIGYANEVIFPFRAVPRDFAVPLEVDVTAFIGVCEKICIPVKHEQALEFATASAPSPERSQLARWKAQVPQPATSAVLSAALAEEYGAVWLHVELAQDARDIFVEGAATLFFGAPQWKLPGRKAKLKVSGAASAGDVRGGEVLVTLATPAGGLEQRITLR